MVNDPEFQHFYLLDRTWRFFRRLERGRVQPQHLGLPLQAQRVSPS